MGFFLYPPCVWSAVDIHIWCVPNLPRSNYMSQYLLSLSVQIQYLNAAALMCEYLNWALLSHPWELPAQERSLPLCHSALGWEMWGSFSISSIAQTKRQVPLSATSSHLFLCSPKVYHSWCYCSALNQKSLFFFFLFPVSYSTLLFHYSIWKHEIEIYDTLVFSTSIHVMWGR